MRLRVAGVGSLHPFQVVDGRHQPLITLLSGLQSLIREVDGATIVGREDEEAYRHWRVSLVERRMITRKELLQSNEIAERFSHFLAVDGNHIIVHPVLHHLVALRSHSLSNLTLVVREDEIHSSSVYIEVIAKVFTSHGRALAVPSGESVAPRARPPHDMLRHGLLPQSEVRLIVFLRRTGQFATFVDYIAQVSSRKYAIVILFVVLFDIEIYRSVALIRIAVVENFLHELLLFDDMSGGMRLYRRRQNVQRAHRIVVAVSVILRYLHGLKLLETGLLLYFVVAFVGIVLKMAYVSDVPDVANLVSNVLKVAEKDVESDCRTGVSEVRVAVNGWSADIHSHVGRIDRLEEFLLPVKRIVNYQVLHNIIVFCCFHLNIFSASPYSSPAGPPSDFRQAL